MFLVITPAKRSLSFLPLFIHPQPSYALPQSALFHKTICTNFREAGLFITR